MIAAGTAAAAERFPPAAFWPPATSSAPYFGDRMRKDAGKQRKPEWREHDGSPGGSGGGGGILGSQCRVGCSDCRSARKAPCDRAQSKLQLSIAVRQRIAGAFPSTAASLEPASPAKACFWPILCLVSACESTETRRSPAELFTAGRWTNLSQAEEEADTA